MQSQGDTQSGQTQNSPQRVPANPLDLGRAPSPATPIQLEGRLNGRPVRFMLDSGAMCKLFCPLNGLNGSRKAACQQLPACLTKFCSSQMVHRSPAITFFPKQQFSFTAPRQHAPTCRSACIFDVAGLQGYDAILGKSWLDKHNPDIDWKRHIVTVHRNGKTFVMQQRKPAAPSLAHKSTQQVKDNLLSAKQMQRLMRKKQGTFFVAYINEVQDLNATAEAGASVIHNPSSPLNHRIQGCLP